ncbi:MAG: DUF4173 domain-containing protein [Actinomycetota bacterium]|nr:DUF4173 domain-containing protein [Actinomycetota bacterium]
MTGPSRKAFSIGALACGVVAGLLPGHPLGLGVGIVAAIVAATVAAGRPAPVDFDRGFFGLSAVVLFWSAALRSAGWVVGLNLLFGFFLGSYAVVGGRSTVAIVKAGTAAFRSLHVGLLFVARPLVEGVQRLPAGKVIPVLRAVGLSAALTAVFGLLFVSADRAFSHFAGEVLVPEVDISLMPARVYVFALVAAAVGSLVVIGPRYAVQPGDPFPQPPRASVERSSLGKIEWVPVLTSLNALFGAFVVVQMTVLFGGRDHVLETTGLTYAQYARQGFFQLIGVAVLTLLVIAGVVRWADIRTRRDRMLARLLLGLLCTLTIVILISALKRLNLYESIYGWTRLRLSVHATILWLGAVFILVLVAGALWKASWLPRACLYLTVGFAIAFTAINPDGVIARQNVARYLETGRIDVGYLSGLSPDAVPALYRLPADLRGCLYQKVELRIGSADSWPGFNLGRSNARQAIETARAGNRPLCPASGI